VRNKDISASIDGTLEDEEGVRRKKKVVGWSFLLLLVFHPPPSPTPPWLCKLHKLWNTSLLYEENSTMGARPKV